MSKTTKKCKDQIFAYSWHIDDMERERTSIRIYGLDKKNRNVCVRVENFTPYVYVQLPIQCKSKFCPIYTEIRDSIDERMGDNKPYKYQFLLKKRLYYSRLDSKDKVKLFPYVRVVFSHHNDIKKLMYRLKAPVRSFNLNRAINLKIHESNATPILQLISNRKLPTANWISINGRLIEDENVKLTTCDKEYRVNWKELSSIDIPKPGCPLILGFDIEVNSSNPSVMPSARKRDDVIFQISCCLFRYGDSDTSIDKYLLTLGNPDPQTTGIPRKNILVYKSEIELLMGFTKFLHIHKPNLIVGYNILSFDIPYMTARAKHHRIIHKYSEQGFLKDTQCAEKEMKWSSSAYGFQTFQYLDTEGRVWVDLLPLVKRDYKLSNYKLKTVSTHFLGSTKDPLSVKGIFKCYRIGIKKTSGGTYSNKAMKAMAIVGKYCVQDSALVIRLFNKLQSWIGLCEMASTCNVPIMTLYTQGQQIKVFSQLYRYCTHHNFVVERDVYKPKPNERYVGAIVFDPIPGVYEKVLPFDFASLYPTTIIAYNIDYSTLVRDSNVPDDKCNVMEWEDHIGCEHDKIKRKQKPKNIMCCKRKFRFIKEPKGVVPTVLQNLLDSRAHTRKQIKLLKKVAKGEKVNEDLSHLIPINDPSYNPTLEKEQKNIMDICAVLNKRQLAYKVSANSMYGAMGVTKGYLPFMPGAMCTTAMGRKNIQIVADTIQKKYHGRLVYGDTDSNYIVFPHLKTAEQNWDFAEKVADEVTQLFPKPIKLEFEEEIYWRFFILTKKRYMYRKCKRDGIVDQNIGNKGVLLARRDNSPFLRNLYRELIMKIFNREPRDIIVNFILEQINLLCCGFFPYTDFIVTKSVGNHDNFKVIPFENEKGVQKGQMGQYKVTLLSTEEKERTRQFKLKNCSNEEDYYIRCLPAVVQLAQRMRNRGKRVDIGSRLEYLVTTMGGDKGKQYEKIEDSEYFCQFRQTLRVDYLYYLKIISNPIDDVLNILYDNDSIRYRYKFQTNFVLNQYKFRLKIRKKLQTELLKMFQPKLKFIKNEIRN